MTDSLQTRLDAYKAGFKQKVPQAIQDQMKQATDELRDSGIVQGAIQIGDTIPDFTLTNQEDVSVNLQQLLQNGPVVINFFRGKWCPYCNIELESLNEYQDAFAAEGATLLAIAPQASSFSKALVDEKKLNFDILEDKGNLYAEALGIKFTLPAYLCKIYSGFGIDLPAHNGDDSWTLPLSARIIIDQQGNVQYLATDPDYTQRPDPSVTLDSLRQLKKAAA